MNNNFDAIVVGSGISGGWAIKELTERGLKVLLIERGSETVHGADYVGEGKAPWELPYRGAIPEDTLSSEYFIQKQCYALNGATKQFFVNDRQHPYISMKKKPFSWIRGYQLGGRSLLWYRQSYRWSEMDFNANKIDGFGVDWPIRYKDIAPWYDHVETFAGISGSKEGLEQLPDGQFLPPMEMNCVELEVKKQIERQFPGRKMIIGRCAHLTQPTKEHLELGRGQCQSRDECERGCSFGAYFSTLSATLPAAKRTNNLTILVDSIAHSIVYDESNKRASGVRVINAKTKTHSQLNARLIFLCASTLGTTQIMLNSKSDSFPNGIANSSGTLGHYLMDHIFESGANGDYPGFQDRYFKGRRPNGIYIPRYRNVTSKDKRFLRGFGFQGGGKRPSWNRAKLSDGIGKKLKEQLRRPGPWTFSLGGFGEMLPDKRNRVWLDEKIKDKWGIPILNIDCMLRENELEMLKAMSEDAKEMLEACGMINVKTYNNSAPPGLAIHEMGTARMGHDPSTSVLNKYNQAHDVPNLFISDGSCMASSACQNPSLTYMALTARAASNAVDMLKEGRI
ncbi:MAG: GMC family oxidoreductase [Pseudomonadota bacterium]|nr:GMC family oxidoreductase [Pseudomonadota bacterium]